MHTRKVRQIYNLLFCTNTQYSMPLHVPLVEEILCHEGSLELVRLFNRVGAVASIDTTSRVATQAVQLRQSRGVLSDLVPGTLTIIISTFYNTMPLFHQLTKHEAGMERQYNASSRYQNLSTSHRTRNSPIKARKPTWDTKTSLLLTCSFTHTHC